MAKRFGKSCLLLSVLVCTAVSAHAQDIAPQEELPDRELPLRQIKLDRLEALQKQKLLSGDIDPSQYDLAIDLIEDLRQAQPGIDFPLPDDAPTVNITIPLANRPRGQMEMPLPGAGGAGTLMPELLETLNSAFEDWEACKTSGEFVYGAACNLTAGTCQDLASGYRNHCFTLVTPGLPVKLPARTGFEDIPFGELERSIVLLRTDDTHVCTGVFLDAGHILTAGHCRQYIEDCLGSGTGCEPGFHRIGSRAGTMMSARLLSTAYSGGDLASDFDIWQTDMPAADVRVLRILPLAAERPEQVNIPATIIGASTFTCPPGRPDCPAIGALWQAAPFTNCIVTCKTPAGTLFHQCQTAPGQSGAPILHWLDGELRLSGIHIEFYSGPKPAACPGESQVGVAMSGICRWIDDHAPNLRGSCLEN